MKPINYFVIVLLLAATSALSWFVGKTGCMETFYAHEANFYGRKLQEMEKNGVDLRTGVGAFISARHVYCANRGNSIEMESYSRLLPETISDFQNDFGNDPCLYKEDLEKLRKK